jgi:hypothetical protein
MTPTGRNRSLVTNTSKCGWAISDIHIVSSGISTGIIMLLEVRCVGTAFWTFFYSGLSQFHGHGSLARV